MSSSQSLLQADIQPLQDLVLDKHSIAAGKTQIESAEKELKDSEDKLEDSRKAARENANIDTLLSLDTLSAMISAQNFSMPAGYIEDKSSHQWLVEVGDNFTNEKQLKILFLQRLTEWERFG